MSSSLPPPTERTKHQVVQLRMLLPKMRRAKWVLVVYVSLLLLLIISADAGWGRRFWHLVQRIPLGDKAGHFILFGALSFLVNWVLHASEFRLGRLRVLKGSVILMALVFLEELSQLGFRSRSFDVYDLLADALGIWLFGVWARHRLQSKNRPATPLVVTPG